MLPPVSPSEVDFEAIPDYIQNDTIMLSWMNEVMLP